MPIDFPGSPNVGDTFSSGTTSWSWNGTEWVAAPAGNWTEAPSDNQRYDRRNQSWALSYLQQDAPVDGNAYRRQFVGAQMTWTLDPIQVEAPKDGNYYARNNGGWLILSPTFTLKTYVDAQISSTLSSANAHTDGIAVPVGGVVMYTGPTAPANFLNCDGTVYNISAYPKLAAVTSNRYGGDGTTTFGVPNMGGRLPIQTTLGAAGGAGQVALGVANLPAHGHIVPAHGHGFNDPGHAHSQVAHNHGVSDPGHAHSYQVWTNSGGMSVYGQATYYQGTTGATTGGSGTGISIQNAQPGIYAAATGCSVANAGAFWTDNGQGSGSAFNIYPPYMGFNFIIRYQ